MACALLASLGAAIYYYQDDVPALLQSSAIALESEPKQVIGLLLFTPYSGHTCRQSQFDNATGQIRDGGFIDCDAAKAQNVEKWSWQADNQRQIAFRNSFRNR